MRVSAPPFRRIAGGATPIFCRRVGANTPIPDPSPIEGEGSLFIFDIAPIAMPLGRREGRALPTKWLRATFSP